MTETSTPYRRKQIDYLIKHGWRRVRGDQRRWRAPDGTIATRAQAYELQRYWEFTRRLESSG